MAPRPPANLLPLYLRYEPETGKVFWLQGPKRKKEAGCKRVDGYWHLRILGSLQLRHRVIWALRTGEWPIEIDHIDRNRSNDCWSNLRAVTRDIQVFNKGKYKNNTSGHVGVSQDTETRWRARIRIAGKLNYLGSFKTREEAAKAYTDAKLNFHKTGTQTV